MLQNLWGKTTEEKNTQKSFHHITMLVISAFVLQYFLVYILLSRCINHEYIIIDF